ncbi:hypothetical protein NDU88_003739 [Pleurodeles waltl]|uniref:Uncharacterized protein n=1 Tax=Pleurodeles waltl TaxID=8319 RepID=A0AAV7UF37_PLEWA|nr:hypothetical protein NDU88_003739 [Pleurodeles waltl]
MPNLVAGHYVRVNNPGLVEKGAAHWSGPINIEKVLDGAVKLEDGRIRNLRHVSLCKEVNIREREDWEMPDDIDGHLLGSDSKLQRIVCPDICSDIHSDGGSATSVDSRTGGNNSGNVAVANNNVPNSGDMPLRRRGKEITRVS